MSKSSTEFTVSNGETLEIAAEVIKLLTPALKHTNKGQIERLKSRSKEVQRVFARMLQGEWPVQDRSYTTHSSRIENNTGLVFWMNLKFVAVAKASLKYSGAFDVTIEILTDPTWSYDLHAFDQIYSLGDCDEDGKIFISYQSVSTRGGSSQEILRELSEKVQSSLLTDRLSLFFSKSDLYEDKYIFHVSFDGCSGVFAERRLTLEELKPLLDTRSVR